MRVVLRGLKGEECVLGCINLDKWLESRVGLLGMTFAVKKMGWRKEDVMARSVTLYRVVEGGVRGAALDEAALIGEVLADEAVYDVAVGAAAPRTPNDPALGYDQSVGESASPYWAELRDAGTREAITWRDPRLGVGGFDDTPPPRFDVGDAAAYDHMAEHGYVVFKNALDGGDVAAAKDLFWRFMEAHARCEAPPRDDEAEAGDDAGAGAVRRDDVTTWHWVTNPINGLLGVGGIGQSDFLWFVRTRPRVLAAFARLWDCGCDYGDAEACAAALLTSFDGCGTFRPWAAASEWRTMPGWWHVDQNALAERPRAGKCAIQGLVSLFDADGSTGSFCVLPGTHKQHDALSANSKATVGGKGHFIPLRGADPLLKRSVAKFVSCEAGDLVCWDSRAVHCSLPAYAGDGGLAKLQTLGDGARAEDCMLRLTAYVCMSPKRVADDVVRRKRKIWWHAGATTTHWPNDWTVSMMPEDSGVQWPLRELRDLPSPRLAARLIGWDDAPVLDALPTLAQLDPLFGEWAKSFPPEPADDEGADDPGYEAKEAEAMRTESCGA